MNRNENQMIIKALNMYGRVPETWELLEEIEEVYQALLDIDKYTREIKLCNASNMPINIDKSCKHILDIVNKALGSDKE